MHQLYTLSKKESPMKTTIYISSILFGLFLYSCCNNNSEEATVIPEVDILHAYSNEKEFNLSQIVQDVDYVKLENHPEAHFSLGIPILADNYILIEALFEKKLLLFTDKGEFLRSIGQNGKGPQEYLDISEVSFHPDGELILIHDYSLHKLLVYSTSDKCVREFIYSDRYGDPFDKAFFNSSGDIQIVLRRPFEEINDFHMVRILDDDFNEKESLFKISNKKVGDGFTTGFSNYFISNGSLHIQEFFYDTVFIQQDEGFSPLCHIQFTSNSLPAYFIPRPPGVWGYNSLYYITGYSNYLFLYVNLPDITDDYVFMVFNLKTEELIRVKEQKFVDKKPGFLMGINNDIDGFSSVVFAGDMGNKFADVIDIIDAKDLLDQNKYLEEVKFSKKQQELIKMIKDSDIEDNPIVRIFTLQ